MYVLPTIFLSFAIALLALIGFLWTYLNEFTEDTIENEDLLEEWVKPIVLGLALVSIAIILSNVNLPMEWTGINFDINLTGTLLPMVITIYLIVKRKLDLIDMALIVVVAGALAMVSVYSSNGSILIDFVHWQLIVAVVSIMTIFLVIKREKSSPLGLAFSSGFVSMLVGGDILGIVRLQLGNTHQYIGGFGVLDFVFLVSVEAVACVWIGRTILAWSKSDNWRVPG